MTGTPSALAKRRHDADHQHVRELDRFGPHVVLEPIDELVDFLPLPTVSALRESRR